MQIIQSRRDFLADASLAAGASVFGRLPSRADEPPPEVTTIRLSRTSAICTAPEYIASDLLRVEGFTDIRHIPAPAAFPELKMIENGEVDFCVAFALPPILELDAGNPLTLHGPAIHAEMEAMQAAGMTPMQVIVASTATAARAMGLGERIGTIEKGKEADLLVVGADPAADVKNFRKTTHVVRGGVVRSADDLRAMAR